MRLAFGHTIGGACVTGGHGHRDVQRHGILQRGLQRVAAQVDSVLPRLIDITVVLWVASCAACATAL